MFHTADKDRYIKLLSEVDRPGIASLINYLEYETDFFTAPASSQHHGACEGGLLDHSLAVHDNLLKIGKEFFDDYDPYSFALVALLHDVCKANFYKVDYRNKKNEYGQWDRVPYYAIDDQLPYGHGEKSVMIVSRFIQLSIEEQMGIRWHMCGFDDAARSYGGGQVLSTAMGKFPLITALHAADLMACYFDGK
jgi:hypothetical protein